MTNYYALSTNLQGKQTKVLKLASDLPSQFLEKTKRMHSCALTLTCKNSVKTISTGRPTEQWYLNYSDHPQYFWINFTNFYTSFRFIVIRGMTYSLDIHILVFRESGSKPLRTQIQCRRQGIRNSKFRGPCLMSPHLTILSPWFS
jgi:hypothetical protein